MKTHNQTEKYKNIHIGNFINSLVIEQQITEERLENFFNDSYENIKKTYEQSNISTDMLLKWSKLLKYDFFRLYSTHLMIYHSISAKIIKNNQEITSGIHVRKNIYTPEIKEYILKKVASNEMSVGEVIKKYGVGKTTLYRWLTKNEIKQ